ncbi:esterase/lipase family protein [Microbulbifer pacificus]|uniref:Alpha/beta fold hydrolase n=1 Tax=Microbulbifer pacificus TaxID=407164 RepID=A0AAU0MZV6_9GAMM|nr:alpha/beta fold hydrolase [Microbulbifer pacificus]WOX06039.1 alpha/beta fold hydrolase [Microbulbifer pacificus]
MILLHGLAKSDRSMERLAQAVAEAGFHTVNVDYPSTDLPIEKLAGPAIAPALDRCAQWAETETTDAPRVHFVTHSMGGILVRQYLSRVKPENLGRVVMLGPPNQGSEVVDTLGSFPGFHFMFGDAGMQLSTGKMSVPNQLGAANFDVGIIAGTKSINPILSTLLPNADDGKVSVARTRLKGMHDHLEMPVTHVFMMKNNDVIAQVIHYLRHGRFQREPEESEDLSVPASVTQQEKIQFPDTATGTGDDDSSAPSGEQHQSTSVRATINGYEAIEYLINAKTGQSLAVGLRSNNAQAAYRITAPAAPRALHSGHGQQSSYSFTLPRDGTYRLMIYLLEGAASAGESAEFLLDIQLRNPG